MARRPRREIAEQLSARAGARAVWGRAPFGGGGPGRTTRPGKPGGRLHQPGRCPRSPVTRRSTRARPVTPFRGPDCGSLSSMTSRSSCPSQGHRASRPSTKGVYSQRSGSRAPNRCSDVLVSSLPILASRPMGGQASGEDMLETEAAGEVTGDEEDLTGPVDSPPSPSRTSRCSAASTSASSGSAPSHQEPVGFLAGSGAFDGHPVMLIFSWNRTAPIRPCARPWNFDGIHLSLHSDISPIGNI